MRMITLLSTVTVLGVMIMVSGCDALPPEPVRDNTHDPGSPYWISVRPYIYSVAKIGTSKAEVKWLSNTSFGVTFKIERGLWGAGTYALVGTVPAPAVSASFIDSSGFTPGSTYVYRVGVVGSAGAVTYSYDSSGLLF